MKKRIGWLAALILTGLVFFASMNLQSTTVAGVRNVSPHEVAKLIEVDREVVVLDIRTPREYHSGHIRSAVNVDYHASTFRQSLSKLNRDATYIVHCERGVRSSRSLSLMKKLGFKNIVHMNGGMRAWRRSTLVTVRR